MTALSTRTLVDGGKNIVIQGYVDGEGAGGELTDTVVFDASAFNADTGVRLMAIWGDLADFQIVFEWDETTDVPLWTLFAGNSEHDFSKIGGINNPAGAGSTGDITLTTLGVGANEAGSFILWLQRS